MRFRRVLVLLVTGLFFVFDRFLKWQALHGWSESRLWRGWVGWSPFFNPGVAFSLPVPGWLIIALTVPVLGLLASLVIREFRETRNTKHETFLYGCNTCFMLHASCFILIFAGALSNFIDRLLYQHTVDYFRVFTGVINLADVMIVSGFVIYLLMGEKIRRIC